MLFVLIFLQVLVLSLHVSTFAAFPHATLSYRTVYQSIQYKISSFARKSHSWKFFHHPNDNTLTSPDGGEEIEALLRQAPIPPSERVFLINGWRWHTLSVIRDLKRFGVAAHEARQALTLSSASRAGNSGKTEKDYERQGRRLEECFQFVYRFSWTALMHVEKEIFFPWLLEVLPAPVHPFVQRIASLHDRVQSLGETLAKECHKLRYDHSLQSSEQIQTLEAVDALLIELGQCAQHIKEIQDDILVPVVSGYVGSKAQDKFNRRVLLGLGLLNSQIHLVSMYEAVKENEVEYAAFLKQIPRVAQLTIPIWRNRLYNPRSRSLSHMD
eukprot:gene5087-5591_t